VSPHRTFTGRVDKQVTEPEVPASPPPPDDLSAERVIAELQKLRKGRGVYAADLSGRVGECLRELASGHAGRPRDVAAFRRLLVTELSACAAQLSEEMRQARLDLPSLSA
jgi:hypothetical protein